MTFLRSCDIAKPANATRFAPWHILHILKGTCKGYEILLAQLLTCDLPFGFVLRV